MTLGKDLSKLIKRRPLLIIGIVVAIIALFLYNNQKGSFMSGMNNPNTHKKNSSDPSKSHSSHDDSQSMEVQPANPIGQNEGPGNATGYRTITSGIPENCLNRATVSAKDLLPADQNEWGDLNPSASGGNKGDFKDMNLLDAGHHIGVDSVGSALRNANLQLRSEPPNPQTQVSPWLNSTIEPDLIRRPLDCPY